MQKEVVLSKIDHKTIRPRDFPLGQSLGVGDEKIDFNAQIDRDVDCGV